MFSNLIKRQINRLAYRHVSNYGFHPFQTEIFSQWSTVSDRKVDHLVSTSPILGLVKWLLPPFYFLKPKWHGLLLVIGLLYSFSSMENWMMRFLEIGVIYLIFILLLSVGCKAYQFLWRTISRGEHRYIQELVHMLNGLVHVVNQDPNLRSYHIAEDKRNPEWFHIHLHKQTGVNTEHVDTSFLESIFNKQVHRLTYHPDSLFFQIHIMSDNLQAKSAPSAAASSNPRREMSPAEREENLRKAYRELDDMVGLQPVKEYVRELNDWVVLQKQRSKIGQSLSQQSMHMVFTGNPGTGKTTVARIVATILSSLDVISKGHLVEVTREDLVAEYIGQTAPKTKKVIQQAMGGVLFIDEAYTLARGGENDFGREAIDTLVKAMEDHRSDLVIILAGYTKEMQEFLQANSGLKSRFPNQIEFPDYTVDELLSLAHLQLRREQLQLTPEAEKALSSVLQRKQIAGRTDDGNGRLVRNVIEEAVRKQSKRLKQSNSYNKTDLTTLLPSDFGQETGEKPFDLERAFAQIVGNQEVKDHIRSLMAQIQIQKMRQERNLGGSMRQSLHMVFKGNPGTGKTTFARLIGQVMKETGILQSGQLIETDRSRLVASYIGQTAPKVNQVIQEALGGILFIDEAYSLIPKGEGDFSAEAIDALVKGMEDHRDSLVVILAGYDQEMDQFFTVNPGLNSRFPHVFHFDNYTADELYQILEQMVIQNHYQLQIGCKERLLPFLETEASNPASSNGRFVRNLFEKAVRNQAVRLQRQGNGQVEQDDLIMLTAEDFVRS